MASETNIYPIVHKKWFFMGNYSSFPLINTTIPDLPGFKFKGNPKYTKIPNKTKAIFKAIAKDPVI